MNCFKKRIAVFLCLLLAIPTLVGVLPMNSLTAEAATTGFISSDYWNIKNSQWENGVLKYSYAISAEAGQEFDMSRLFYYYYFDSKNNYQSKEFSTISGDTYVSSNSKVATVGKNTGIVKVKKKGTTVITIKYKGVSIECTLTAYAKGAFGKTSARNKVASKAKAVIKAYNGKITNKNRYKILNAYKAFSMQQSALSSTMYNGFLRDEYYSDTNKIVVPEAWEAVDIFESLYDYVKKINPIGTSQSNWFKINSVSARAKSRSFTINLKNRVDADDIFAIQFNEAGDDVVTEEGRALFRIKVQDTETGNNYYGWITANKGSKKLTVNMDYLKLVKGRKYKLLGTDTWSGAAKYGWTRGKTFTIK